MASSSEHNIIIQNAIVQTGTTIPSLPNNDNKLKIEKKVAIEKVKAMITHYQKDPKDGLGQILHFAWNTIGNFIMKGEKENIQTMLLPILNAIKITEYSGFPLTFYIEKAFAEFVQKGNMPCVKSLLQAKIPVDYRTDLNSTPLMRAAYVGNVELVEFLLKAKANVDMINSFGSTSLIMATAHTKELKQEGRLDTSALKKCTKIIKLILGQNPNEIDRANHHCTAFALAIRSHPSIVKLFLKLPVDPQFALLCNLSKRSEPSLNELEEFLVETKTDLNVALDKDGNSLMMYVLAQKREISLDLVKILVKFNADVNIVNRLGVTPLFVATKTGQLECCQFLLSVKANVTLTSYKNFTLFMHAALNLPELVKPFIEQIQNDARRKEVIADTLLVASFYGKESMLQLLDFPESSLNTTFAGYQGSSVLSMLAWSGRSQLVKELLKRKASVNSLDQKGVTPLMIAAQQGFIETVSLLLEANANPNQTEEEGNTALAFAVRRGHGLVVKELLHKKALPNLPDKRKVTPIHDAISGRFIFILELLTNEMDKKQCQEIFEENGHFKTPISNLVGDIFTANHLRNLSRKYQLFYSEIGYQRALILQLVLPNFEKQFLNSILPQRQKENEVHPLEKRKIRMFYTLSMVDLNRLVPIHALSGMSHSYPLFAYLNYASIEFKFLILKDSLYKNNLHRVEHIKIFLDELSKIILDLKFLDNDNIYIHMKYKGMDIEFSISVENMQNLFKHEIYADFELQMKLFKNANEREELLNYIKYLDDANSKPKDKKEMGDNPGYRPKLVPYDLRNDLTEIHRVQNSIGSSLDNSLKPPFSKQNCFFSASIIERHSARTLADMQHKIAHADILSTQPVNQNSKMPEIEQTELDEEEHHAFWSVNNFDARIAKKRREEALFYYSSRLAHSPLQSRSATSSSYEKSSQEREGGNQERREHSERADNKNNSDNTKLLPPINKSQNSANN